MYKFKPGDLEEWLFMDSELHLAGEKDIKSIIENLSLLLCHIQHS